MKNLPTGTVTFFFTDIEGSTRLVQRLGEGFRNVAETHAAILRETVGRWGGLEVGERGDGFFFVFPSALNALAAAVDGQRALAHHPWPPDGEVRVRMGLHTGEGIPGGDNYIGLDVHRAARIADTGHGGQIVLSESTAALARYQLPPESRLDDLGSYRLKDFPGPVRLHQLSTTGLRDGFPPLRTVGSVPVNLPRQLTSFIGRARELRRIIRALAATRLLTLTGPGGTGKTRLALQAAAEEADRFPDGVFFAALAPLTDPALVVPTVVSVIGLPETQEDPASLLLDFLRPRRILLLLDNFEQILDAGLQVADWLREAPGLTVLVTSRSPLHLSGETEYPVPPLEVPDPSTTQDRGVLARSESVALFAARAAAAKPDFAITKENAPAVAQIVAHLDGLPLAIELAAARVKLFPPEAILARISSRLAFLAGGARDLPDRQKTLRGAIAWSYDLLDPPVRHLFRRLSVFIGGAALAEAETVCGPPEELGTGVPEGLEVLVDQSLVRQNHSAGEPRFSMLETIREYACELLAGSGEQDSIEERHATAYLTLAETSEPHLTRRGRCGWFDRLEEDIDNIRAALSRYIGRSGAERAQRMVAALWRFWQTRGHVREGRSLAAEALRLPGDDIRSRIEALLAESGMAYWQADMAKSGDSCSEALRMAREMGDRRLLALALYNSAFPAAISGRPDEARAMLDESLALCRELDDRDLVGEVLWGIGTILWFTGEQAASEQWYDRALEALADSDAVFVIGWTHRQRGVVRLGRDDPVGARADLETSLSMFLADRDVPGVVLHLRDFADLALSAGEHERALRLAGAAIALQTISQTGILEFAQNQVVELFAENQPVELEDTFERLGPRRTEELLAEGRNMSMEQAVEYALHPSSGTETGRG